MAFSFGGGNTSSPPPARRKREAMDSFLYSFLIAALLVTAINGAITLRGKPHVIINHGSGLGRQTRPPKVNRYSIVSALVTMAIVAAISGATLDRTTVLYGDFPIAI